MQHMYSVHTSTFGYIAKAGGGDVWGVRWKWGNGEILSLQNDNCTTLNICTLYEQSIRNNI